MLFLATALYRHPQGAAPIVRRPVGDAALSACTRRAVDDMRRRDDVTAPPHVHVGDILLRPTQQPT